MKSEIKHAEIVAITIKNIIIPEANENIEEIILPFSNLSPKMNCIFKINAPKTGRIITANAIGVKSFETDLFSYLKSLPNI